MNNKRLILVVTLIFSSFLFAAKANVYLYVLPFDNLKADPTIDWISSSLTDMVKESFSNEISVLIKNQEDLEEVMNDRSLMLRQPRGSRNILFIGKYYRKLEQVHVSIQIVDLSTWDELKSESLMSLYTDMPGLNKNLVALAKKIVEPFLPKGIRLNKMVIPKYIKPKIIKKEHPVSMNSNEISKGLEKEFNSLEKTMDILVGLQEQKTDSKIDISIFKGNEWAMAFTPEEKVDENPELVPNTVLLNTVLGQLIENPYNIEISRPKFVYLKDNDDFMTVQLNVKYSLKDQIMKEILSSLPYNNLIQDGSLTTFYFSRESFNLSEEIVNQIKLGEYRSTPVIRFFNGENIPLVVIVDTPEEDLHNIDSEKVLYLPEQQFTPLIEFTAGGWSLQVSMEAVEINAKYEFTLPMFDVKSLRNVSLKFIKETELKPFLDVIL